MIEDAGGWQHDTLTEDSDLSYRAQLKGWRFVYLPGLDCPSELPVEMHGFQVQQSRWAKGLTQVAKKLLPTILRADLPWRVKAEAIMHLTPNISYPLMIVVSALMLPVMIVRFYMGVLQMLFLDLPLIVASFWSISAFYVVAQRELYPEQLEAIDFPAADADGRRRGADDHQHPGGVWKRCSACRPLRRVPQNTPSKGRPVSLENKKYRRKSGWLPYLRNCVWNLLPRDGGLRDRIL